MQKRHLLGTQRNRGRRWNRGFPGSPGSGDTPGRDAAIALWILTNFTGVLQIISQLGPSSQRPRAGSGNNLQIKRILIMPFSCMISYVVQFNQLFFILHCCFLLHHLTFCISLYYSSFLCTVAAKLFSINATIIKSPSISLVSGRMQELNIRSAYCNINWFEPGWKPISNKDLLAFLPLCMTAVEDSIKTHKLKHSVENKIQSKSNWWWLKVPPGSRSLGSGLGTPASAEQLPGCRWESSWWKMMQTGLQLSETHCECRRGGWAHVCLQQARPWSGMPSGATGHASEDSDVIIDRAHQSQDPRLGIKFCWERLREGRASLLWSSYCQ